MMLRRRAGETAKRDGGSHQTALAEVLVSQHRKEHDYKQQTNSAEQAEGVRNLGSVTGHSNDGDTSWKVRRGEGS